MIGIEGLSQKAIPPNAERIAVTVGWVESSKTHRSPEPLRFFLKKGFPSC